MIRSAVTFIVMVTLLGYSSPSGWALGPERVVSAQAMIIGDATLTVDAAQNALVPFVSGTELRFATGPYFLPGGYSIAAAQDPPAAPTIHNSASGISTIVYARDGDLFRVSNLGGPFGSPTAVTQGVAVDRDPVLRGTATTQGLHLVWVREDPSLGPQLGYSFDFGAVAFPTQGDQPSLFVEASGDAHVAYERGGSIYYREINGTVFGAEQTVTLGVGDTTPTVIVTSDGLPHVVFLRGGQVHIAHGNPGSGFGASVVVSSGVGASSPRASLNGNWIEIYYTQGGDLYRVTATSGFATHPVNQTLTPILDEILVDLAIDLDGFAHVIYHRGSQLFYRNDVPVPVADFETDEPVGEAPHVVAFTDTTVGPVHTWLWDFGDGNTSSEQHPIHVYRDVGSYDVSLTVVGVGGLAQASVVDAIEVTEPTNILWIPDVPAVRGQTGVCLPVLATHTGELQGYQIAVTWDCDALHFQAMQLVGSDFEILAPEFIGMQLEQSPQLCYFTAGVLIDTVPPFDNRVLAPGVGHRLTNLIFDVSPTAPATVVVDLQNGVGAPPINNIFIVESFNIDPIVIDGTMTIVDPATAPALFLRGDVNGNGVVNLQDVVILLEYLFTGGTGVSCFDAADGNDSGAVDIADPVFIMSFLFAAGAVIPYPFPSTGLDPTPDTLPDC